MNEKEVLQILSKVGAVITNSHIVYTSGKHGTSYVNKDAIYPHTAETSLLCQEIALRFADKKNIEVVVAPVIGGVILSNRVARYLSKLTSRKVLSVYADKERMEIVSSSYGPLSPKYEDNFVIKRGYDKLITGKNVLVVEDVITTGSSAKKVIEATRAIGGNVIGLGVFCNRGGVTPQDVANVKLTALVNIKLDAWDEENCPLCKEEILINIAVGKGREFLARKKM